MGLTIEDGKGTGYQAEVDIRNMLHTHALIETAEHFASISGNAYNMVFSQTADSTGSFILYIKNQFEEDLIFKGIQLRTSQDESVQVHINMAGTPSSGQATTATNLNAGSPFQAQGIFQVGNNITGLSGGSIVYPYFVKGGESSLYYRFEQDLIIPKNRVIGLSCENGSVKIDGILSFYRDILR